MAWDVKVAGRVFKQLKRVPKKDVVRLFLVIEHLKKSPYQKNLEKIRGEKNVWRIKVSSYRILFEIFTEGKEIWVFNISRRTTTTYKKR